MTDNLEHGWIVDKLPYDGECETEIHCCKCFEILTSHYKYLGMGRYICEHCEKEEEND